MSDPTFESVRVGGWFGDTGLTSPNPSVFFDGWFEIQPVVREKDIVIERLIIAPKFPDDPLSRFIL